MALTGLLTIMGTIVAGALLLQWVAARTRRDRVVEAQKIPFLTLYAVLPVSVVLVGLFSFLGNRFRQATVFRLMMAL